MTQASTRCKQANQNEKRPHQLVGHVLKRNIPFRNTLKKLEMFLLFKLLGNGCTLKDCFKLLKHLILTGRY